MKQYIVTKAIMINSGKIALSPEQVRRRKHLLTQVGDGVFEPKNELFFKVGETIGLPQVSKAMMVHLEPVQTEGEEEAKKPGRPAKK